MSKQPVYLYHYATLQYDVLKTRKAQGVPKPNDTAGVITLNGKEFDYTEHISFFVEPVPLETMGKVYGKEHNVWYPGSQLYEHRVDLSQTKSFDYHFVETPEKIAMLFDDSIDDDEYYKRLKKINRQKGYVGSSLSEFMHPYDQFQGQTKRHVLRASSFPKWDVNRFKYAACVPHVMVYPKTGEMPVESVKFVTIE